MDTLSPQTNPMLLQLDQMPQYASEFYHVLALKASQVIKVDPLSHASLQLPSLESFIKSLVEKAKVKPSIFCLSWIYLDRLQHKLPPSAKGLPCTKHRVFIASLICAYKYLNDITIKNKHWSRLSQYFSLSEINLMERQFLQLMSYELNFAEADVLNFLDHCPSAIQAISSPLLAHVTLFKQETEIIDDEASHCPSITDDPLVTPPELNSTSSVCSFDHSISEQSL